MEAVVIQIIYEYKKNWPEEGTLWVETPSIAGEVKVSPLSARRKANGYLTSEIAMAMRPGEPVLLWGQHPVWRMHIYLHLPDLGLISLRETIEVDAQTREIIPLSPEQITRLQEQAHAMASRLTPETAPAG